MADQEPIRNTIERARGRKRINAATALICGALPAAVLQMVNPPSTAKWLMGFAAGLAWANGFEYVYHRCLLHMPKIRPGQLHQVHHAFTGTPREAEHLNLGGTPPWIVAGFVFNGLIITIADLLLGLRVSPGMFVAFAVYVMAVEEIHWRIHLGGWLPSFMRFSREHHLAHHERPSGRFNVFFPLFDWLLGTAKDRRLCGHP